MRRRLTVAILAVVVGALVVAGLGTLLLARLGARDDTRRDLVDEVRAVAAGLPALAEPPPPGSARPPREARDVLGALRRALRLEGSAVVNVGPTGRVLNPAELPPGLTVEDLSVDKLLRGETVSGHRGDLVYAATAVSRPRGPGLVAIVLTRRVDTGLGRAGAWFLVAGAATVVVAWIVAARLGAVLTRRLRAVENASRRIAAGDLGARVPDTDGGPRDELAALGASVNAMAAALERSRGLERQFLLSVSHELRTPLTSIRGFAEAIAEGAATDHAQAATVIGAEARRLERLVGDLLELGKLESRRFSLDVRATDVAEVVGDTADGFGPAADDAGVRVAVDVPAPPPMAAADPDRLAQVVANLLENALKFAASSIEVGVEQRDGRVDIHVDDDGPGIPDDERGHVFDRLWSSTRAPARTVGSGLGLAIVRELVGAMHGTVRAETAPTGGARLVVSLPSWSSST